MNIYPLAIVGGGSAGTMAVLRSVLNNDDTLFFPGSPKNKKRSRAFWVSKIENMPAHFHYTKGIEDPNKETLKWLSHSPFSSKLQWLKNLGVTGIEKTPEGYFQLTDNKGQKHYSQYVILATGVMDIQPHIAGNIDAILPFANVQLADYCIRCDGHHVHNKHMGVIGHTPSAAWVAVMLYERYNVPSATLFTHGEKPQFDQEATRLLACYGIKVEERPIVAVLGDAKAKTLEGLRLKGGELAALDICFVSLGMIVYNELAKQLGAKLDERGFVLTGPTGESSVKGLYAAGDLRANTKKQIYTSWDSAVDAADHINALLRQQRRP